ncbi:hypothetical protein Tco_1075323 [Tanacetum coccineum]
MAALTANPNAPNGLEMSKQTPLRGWGSKSRGVAVVEVDMVKVDSAVVVVEVVASRGRGREVQSVDVRWGDGSRQMVMDLRYVCYSGGAGVAMTMGDYDGCGGVVRMGSRCEWVMVYHGAAAVAAEGKRAWKR